MGRVAAGATAGGGVAVRAAAAAQVFVDDPAAPVVAPDDHHHLVRVLRLRAGEMVVACDGHGRWRPCRFRGAGGPGRSGDDLLDPDGPLVEEPRPVPALTLAFAPAKGDRPEWVVQKLTELGVDRIVPLLAARSVVRWEGDRAARAVERLRRVAREAAAQSRRVWLPEVPAVQTLADLVGAAGAAAARPGNAPARPGHAPAGAAVSLAQLGGAPPTGATTTLAIGPEGGWAAEELALGLDEVGLAAYVLRAETAAVAAGAVLGALRAGTVVGREVPATAEVERRRPGVGESG